MADSVCIGLGKTGEEVLNLETWRGEVPGKADGLSRAWWDVAGVGEEQRVCRVRAGLVFTRSISKACGLLALGSRPCSQSTAPPP